MVLTLQYGLEERHHIRKKAEAPVFGGDSLAPSLHLDPVTETIPVDEEASQLLRREYRKPFEVPEKI